MYDGSPIPPCPDCPVPGPIESFVSLMLAFWLFFFLLVWLLPPAWGDAIWNTAFPFMPRADAPDFDK